MLRRLQWWTPPLEIPFLILDFGHPWKNIINFCLPGLDIWIRWKLSYLFCLWVIYPVPVHLMLDSKKSNSWLLVLTAHFKKVLNKIQGQNNPCQSTNLDLSRFPSQPPMYMMNTNFFWKCSHTTSSSSSSNWSLSESCWPCVSPQSSHLQCTAQCTICDMYVVIPMLHTKGTHCTLTQHLSSHLHCTAL